MDAIILQGVKTHNLKDFDLTLPHKQLYVVTGVSGSGKSSLAFDTLYAEGQRRYVESLSAYARQFLERMEKPEVDAVTGIPPAIAIQAKNVITNARSTVGTQTEVNDYLRILFARIGKTECPDCHLEVMKYQPGGIADQLLERFAGREINMLFAVPLGKGGKRYLKEFLPELERQGFHEFDVDGTSCDAEALLRRRKFPEKLMVSVDRLKAEARHRSRMVESLELALEYGKHEVFVRAGGQLLRFSEELCCYSCGREFREPSPNLFAFNSPLGACPECQGFGRVITRDWELVVPDTRKTLAEGAIEPWTKPSAAWEMKQMLKFCKRRKIPVNKPWADLNAGQRRQIIEGAGGEDYFSVNDFFDYLEKKTYKMHVRIFLSKYRGYVPCTTCAGTRLKPESLWVKVEGQTIASIQDRAISDLVGFFEQLRIPPGEFEKIEPVYAELKNRLRFLHEVGLGYLQLSRLSRTLSGGEVQRIHLATSLGSALVDTLYVLDEPSIGLHDRDNQLLIRLLKELRDLGNTVVVVEHDRTMIEAADYVIDLGPAGGQQGGKLISQGTVRELTANPHSLTGDYLAGRKKVERRHPVSAQPKSWIRIRGAESHNLKKMDVDFPLGQMVVISGVSGSGKSTLLYEILYNHYLRFQGRPVQDIGKVRKITGFDKFDRMILIDQSPIGKTPRSNPVTYVKAFDEIRKLFAATPDAKRKGYGPGHFSFNVDGGRCPECKGDGRVKVEMHFLADVYVPCEACRGTRYQAETLEIQYRGKNIDEVLALTIEDGIGFFSEHSRIIQKLMPLKNVGLGYLRLGQAATTLSGGEAQRLKLAFEMMEQKDKKLLYLFDEPTTGLHYHDIQYLMGAFEALLAEGHSLIIIEHNMEVIASSDYLVDLGPEGGDKGGEVVYQGPREGVCQCSKSHTGKHLKQYLQKLKPASMKPV